VTSDVALTTEEAVKRELMVKQRTLATIYNESGKDSIANIIHVKKGK